MKITRRTVLAAPLLPLMPAVARAQAMPGVSASEIKIGQTMPYSGPASSYGTIGRAQAAYFKQINEQGGVGGRKLTFLTLDDGYQPPKTLEMTRKLVEQDEVAFMFQMLGTPPVMAARKYLNDRKVPQIFVATGATQFGDPGHFPWTMGWQPTYQTEGHVYAKYAMQAKPGAKIAVLYQNDDSGKDYYRGFRAGLGDQADKLIVATATYEVTDPTVDSQLVSLKNSGAEVFFATGIPKFAAMTIRKVYDLGWKPLYFMANVGSSVQTGLAPAGLEKAVGLFTSSYLKDPTDPQWASDAGFQAYLAWMKKYYPDGDPADLNNAYGYTSAQTLVQVLKQCGNDLTRANIMKQAASLDVELPLLQPGIRIRTSADNFYPIRQLRLVRFDGKAWIPHGEVIGE